MQNNFSPGMRVLMPGSVFSSQYVIVEIERSHGSTLVGREVSPNSGTREIQAEYTFVLGIQQMTKREQRDGILFSKGDSLLQKVTGGYQLVSPVHDIRVGDNLANVRCYAYNPSGGHWEGVSIATSVDILIDPATLL